MSKTGKALINLAVLCLLAASVAAFATRDRSVAEVLDAKSRSAHEQVYIVVMDTDAVPTWFKKKFPNGDFDPTDSSCRSYCQTILDTNLDVLHDHGVDEDRVINNLCFAGAMVVASLNGQQARHLGDDPRVHAVVADRMNLLESSHRLNRGDQPGTIGHRVLGLERRGSPWARGVLGEDVVIGIFDSGIHPEHPSFTDEMVDVDAEGHPSAPSQPYPPPPASWNGDGTCEFGNRAFNGEDAPFTCNNKLLGARAYADGFLRVHNEISEGDFFSARDSFDHGTHIASVAAGNMGIPAQLDGQFLGKISGVAPRARLSIYKTCWPLSQTSSFCASSDVIAAIEQAIVDGVDVINYSAGSPILGFGASERAWLGATDSGIWVVTSVGNTGPEEGTIRAPGFVPWVTAAAWVHSNTIFASAIEITAPQSITGSYRALEGDGPVRLADTGKIEGNVIAANPLLGCEPLRNDVLDQVVLVMRGECSFQEKYANAAAAGARAIVVFNDGETSARMDPFVMPVDEASIPGVMVGFLDGSSIARQLNIGQSVRITWGPDTQIAIQNRIALGSSRGPNTGAPDIVKPDIAAPGVEILAAGSPFTVAGPDDGELFAIRSGSSFSSPHVAGVFALLHQQHPDWSPARAFSAVMTTASQNVFDIASGRAADPFDVGSGLLKPNRVLRPGLVYDAGQPDYIAYICGNVENFPIPPTICESISDMGFSTDASGFNYPSIGVSGLLAQKTVQRTVTSVTKNRRKFDVSIDAPEGVDIRVVPRQLTLSPGESASYAVTFTVTSDAAFNRWVFGSLTWFNDNNRVRSPIAVRPLALVFPEEIELRGVEGNASFDVQFGYTGIYQTRLHGFAPAEISQGTVNDDPNNDFDFRNGRGVKSFRFEYPKDTVYARFQIRDEFTQGDDNLDLYLYRCLQGSNDSCIEIDSSAKLSSNETVEIRFPESSEQDVVYMVAIHGYETDGPSADFTLLSWALGLDDHRDNFIAEPRQKAIRPNETQSVALSWPGSAGLEDNTLYLGAVSHSTEQGIDGLTLIDLDTRER